LEKRTKILFEFQFDIYIGVYESNETIFQTNLQGLFFAVVLDGGQRLFAVADLSSEDLDLDARANVVFTTVGEPGDRRENNHDSKCGDTVVYVWLDRVRIFFSFLCQGLTHAAAGSRNLGREEEENGGEGDICQRDLGEIISRLY